MQPDKFQGNRQQFPLIYLTSVVAIPLTVYITGYTFNAFILCTIFSVLQGWKMGAFVPLFAFVGIKKMERYKFADFKALYQSEELNDSVGGFAPPVGRPLWTDVIHFVVIPNYKERIEDLRMTLNSIAVSQIATRQIGIILAMEKGEEGSKEKAAGLMEEYRDQFRYMVATCHPKVLSNGEHPDREVAGKSANAQWAARRFFAALNPASRDQVNQGKGKHSEIGCLCFGSGSAAAPKVSSGLNDEGKQRRLKKEDELTTELRQQEDAISKALRGQDIDLDNMILTVGDADSQFHSSYFEALTYHFLHAGGKENETPLRHLTMWQPPIIHMKNYLSQPWPVRLASVITSAHELANLADPNATRVAYSTYSLSGKLAQAMDGWDSDWITEDWHTTLKVFLTSGARLRVMPIFLPILNSTPDADTVCQTLWSRWEQAKRHALGISELVFLHEHMLRVLMSIPGFRGKVLFAWRSWFLWFKLMWIHAFVAILPIFAPLNGLLIAFFNRNQVSETLSINSWTFVVNCVFQCVGLSSTIFVFLVSVLLFEAVKTRIDGVYDDDGRDFVPGLSIRWRNPWVHAVVFTLQSLVCLPFTMVAFAAVEWRAATKTALTKGGGFVYVSAAVGAAQAKGVA